MTSTPPPPGDDAWELDGVDTSADDADDDVSDSTDPPANKTLAVALGVTAAVAVMAAAVAVPLLLTSEEQQVEIDRTLDAVDVYEDLPTTHEDGAITYDQSPPVGGRHNPAWLDCGVYDEPVPQENVVHDLEHGTVWITYDPDLSSGEVDELAAALPQNGILSPYDDLRAPVVITVWERQLELTGPDDPRLSLFIESFGAGETAPEPFASCAGGLQPEQTDGDTRST